MEEVTQHPLVIVFYLDSEMMRNRDIIQPFAESVNQMLMVKKANALAFFIPTEGEERVECINPVSLAPADMEKIYAILEDIKTSFVVPIDVPDTDIIPDEKPECTCDGESDEICSCGK